MGKLLIALAIVLLALLMGCCFWAKGVRRSIKYLREDYDELVARGANPTSEVMLEIKRLLDEAERYCDMWRFDLEYQSRRDAGVRLSIQHTIVPPFYRLGRRRRRGRPSESPPVDPTSDSQ